MQKQRQEAEKPIAEFFESHYPTLLKYCHRNWNGNGNDVLHQTFVKASERYTTINFSLFRLLALEAARDMGLFYTTYNEECVVLLPRSEHNALRLEKAKAVADDDSNVEVSPGAKAHAKRLLREETRGQLHFWSNKQAGDEAPAQTKRR